MCFIISLSTFEPTAAEAQNNFIQEFSDPSTAYRPKTRWWIPGSHMTKTEIERELKSISEAGFGGIEIVPFAIDGGDGEDIDWGSQQWKEITKYVLETAETYKLTVDFTMTPAWPLALPTITDLDNPSQGAQMEVDGAYVDGITKDSPYNGQIPVPADAKLGAGTPSLVAVTIAKYSDKDKSTPELDYNSAESIDLTNVVYHSNIPTDCSISYTPEDDGEYVLFGWWQHPSGNKKYNNYQVDHYGLAGTQAIIDYWENELISYYGVAFKNAASLFIDSLEFETHLDWTDDLLEEFKKIKGYDYAAYLPAVYEASSSGNYRGNPTPDFSFNQNTESLKNDFYDHLTYLYIENHLKPLSEFCNKHGVQLRYQTAYGKNLELPQTAMYVDIPETETLYGSDILDFYRLQSGAVHLTGKEIYSIEASPEYNMVIGDSIIFGRGNGEDSAGNYQQTWGSQMWHIQRALAGGVNQIVFHGYSYNGHYDGPGNENGYLPGIEWPGFEGFGRSSFSNSWGERSPNWKHASDYLNFISRNQFVLRTGRPKVDVAIYTHRYWEDIDFLGASKVYDDSILEQFGYSYEFISPSAFMLDNAIVTNGVLDEQGVGYKAIILDNETVIPSDAADFLLHYAEQGLPIIFIGTIPIQVSYHDTCDITEKIERLFDFDNVVLVSDRACVPQTLGELGVTPDVSYSSECEVLNVHRQTDDIDFYYLYNYGDADNYPEALELNDVSTTITLKGNGIPYLLDTWTGEITPIAYYRKTIEGISIDITLGGNESTIIALADEYWFEGTFNTSAHVTEADINVEYDDQGNLIAKSYDETVTSVKLSNGDRIIVEFEEIPEAFEIKAWKLEVENWTKGASASESSKTPMSLGIIEGLKPWLELDGLEGVSGIGLYTVEIMLESGWDEGIGAVLDLGNICDTYQIAVNGTLLTTNQINTRLDIGPYLKTGKNIIQIEVASTLLNAILTEYPDSNRSHDEYGLIGPVFLNFYGWVSLISNSDLETPSAETIDSETSSERLEQTETDSSDTASTASSDSSDNINQMGDRLDQNGKNNTRTVVKTSDGTVILPIFLLLIISGIGLFLIHRKKYNEDCI